MTHLPRPRGSLYKGYKNTYKKTLGEIFFKSFSITYPKLVVYVSFTLSACLFRTRKQADQ